MELCIYIMSMDVHEKDSFYWILLDLNGFYWILLNRILIILLIHDTLSTVVLLYEEAGYRNTRNKKHVINKNIS